MLGTNSDYLKVPSPETRAPYLCCRVRVRDTGGSGGKRRGTEKTRTGKEVGKKEITLKGTQQGLTNCGHTVNIFPRRLVSSNKTKITTET